MISRGPIGAYGMPGAMLAPAYPHAFVSSPGLGPLAASTNTLYGAYGGAGGFGGLLGTAGPIEVAGIAMIAFLILSEMRGPRRR